jgi:hypothetical protein
MHMSYQIPGADHFPQPLSLNVHQISPALLYSKLTKIKAMIFLSVKLYYPLALFLLVTTAHDFLQCFFFFFSHI